MQVFALAVRLMISAVPKPAPVRRIVGPPNMLLGAVAVRNDRLKTSTILRRDLKGYSMTHALQLAQFAPRHTTLTASPHSADLTVLIFSLLGSGEMFSL